MHRGAPVRRLKRAIASAQARAAAWLTLPDGEGQGAEASATPKPRPKPAPPKGPRAGTKRHRAFVGPPRNYDLLAAVQFNLLTLLGLREHHTLLDIGCGSLRAGRLFIVYLQPEHYFGIEPERWLVAEGIRAELGREIVALKRPQFSFRNDFALSSLGRTFDFLIAQSIFSHAAPGQILTCMQEAAKVMTPDSVFAASFVEAAENHCGDQWVYPNCVGYRPAFMSEVAAAAGLRCQHLEWTRTGQRWMLLYRRPPSARLPHLPRELGTTR